MLIPEIEGGKMHRELMQPQIRPESGLLHKPELPDGEIRSAHPPGFGHSREKQRRGERSGVILPV